MKKTRFTEAQIVAILRELDAGVPVAELARKHGVHANTIRLWRDKYGGMETSDLAKLRQLQDENRRKDRIIARMALEIDAMKGLVEKNAWGPRKQEAVRALRQRGISAVRACDLISYNRSNLYYHRTPIDDEPIVTRLKSLATERPRWGWRRLLIMVRRDKIVVGETRFRRIYRALELQVRARRKRKVNYVRGNFIEPVSQPNARWSIDFMHDRIENGRSIRALAVVDDFTRECLTLHLEHSLGSADVIREFERIAFDRDLPKTIRFDNELREHVKGSSTIGRASTSVRGRSAWRLRSFRQNPIRLPW